MGRGLIHEFPQAHAYDLNWIVYDTLQLPSSVSLAIAFNRPAKWTDVFESELRVQCKLMFEIGINFENRFLKESKDIF